MFRYRWSFLLAIALLACLGSRSILADEPVAEAKVKDAKPAALTGQKEVELLQLFADTLDQVERNYVQPIDRRELMEAAIRGMLTKLDAHSSYIPPAELDRFN